MPNKPMLTQPKQKRGRQRVEAILNAASELFAEVGYESATIIEIAARAKQGRVQIEEEVWLTC